MIGTASCHKRYNLPSNSSRTMNSIAVLLQATGARMPTTMAAGTNGQIGHRRAGVMPNPLSIDEIRSDINPWLKTLLKLWRTL
mgnify:CR=1 FL=1